MTKQIENYSLRHKELKEKAHEHIDALKIFYTEEKIRKGLSKYMGIAWDIHNTNSGFHFSHTHSIKDIEKAIAWLALAAKQKTLSPLTKEQKEQKRNTLSQAKMKTALASLPRRKKLSWWQKLLILFW